MASTHPSPTRRSAERTTASPIRSGLAVAVTVSWLYLMYMAWGMANMDQPAARLLMPAMTHWGAVDLALVVLMWAIMMAAMMLPSAVPMVQMYARSAEGQSGCVTGRLTGAFVGGYLAVWTAFSTVITLAQWGLLELRLVTPMMESASSWLSGGLLLAAGAFQFTAFKNSCLKKCRTPLGFLLAEWRPGVRGAFIMGLRHGVYCAGCCAMLMLLLFVLGVMNLAWIFVLTLIVLVEKLLPGKSVWPSRALGAGLIAWGSYVLLSAQA
jgi:predicted metal-binding membrane protein